MVQRVSFNVQTQFGMQKISLVGNVKCRHNDGSYCIKLDSSNYNISKSSHHDDPYVYYIHRNIDIYEYNEDILQNLKSRWKDLIFKQVSTIILKLKDIEYTRRYYYGGYEEIKYNNNFANLRNIENDENVRNGYSKYIGLTRRDPDGTETHNMDEKYKHIAIFQKSNNAELSFISPTIGEWDFKQCPEPPNKGELICGLIYNAKTHYQYNRWFVCSPQFYKLYILILHGREHELFSGKNKNQIMNLLETNRSKKIIGPPSQKEKDYKHNNYEKAYEYPDLYKAIAELFYFQDGIPIKDRKIPEMFWLPSPPEIYKFSLLASLGINVRL